MEPLTELDLRGARSAIAWARSRADAPVQVGQVVLRGHQREAVMRIGARLDVHRGCLLAEDVGRGKTFVALAVARRWRQPLVVIPAALRDTWLQAMRRAQVDLPLLTHEALSRGARPSVAPDGVIVDESHHFRNPSTLRYDALADVSMHGELLLLSATPLQNGIRDLVAQLALFLGSGAGTLTEAQLAEHLVRVAADDADAEMPRVSAPCWIHASVDDAAVLRAIMDLPAPPRALDAGDAGALGVIGLVRSWASSRAAFALALDRRRKTVTAMEQSVEAGRMPTRAEVRSWHGAGDDAIQLGFASLLVQGSAGDVSALREAIGREHRALDGLVRLLKAGTEVDASRAAALARIVSAHAGERVIAFTERADTARAYFALLRHRPGVSLMTSSDARIASGRITRRELLARFSPGAQGCAEPSARERITLLISTDLLSEGVNLQDASVVVHLDMPWNPARLTQRVGRVRRPAGAPVVSSYLLAPPASTELLLDVESRLRRKLADAERSIGRGLEVVPALSLTGVSEVAARRAGLVDAGAALQARIASWKEDASPPEAPVLRAAVESDTEGWLAMLASGRLLGSLNGGGVSEDVLVLEYLVALAERPSRQGADAELESAGLALARYLERERVLTDCGATTAPSGIAGVVERRAARLLRRSTRAARSTDFRRLASLRQALGDRLSLGMERALTRMMTMGAEMSFEIFVDVALAVLRRPPVASDLSTGDPVRVMIVMGRE